MHQSDIPPGPRGLPLVGSIFDYFRDILGFLIRNSRQYGDIVYFRLGPRNVYMLNDPEMIKQVLVTDSRNFTKSRALDRAKMVVGEGLLTSEGESHLRNRRVIQPLFHKKAIPNYANSVVTNSEVICSEWDNGQNLDMNREMMKLTQAIVVEALFNSSVEDSSKKLVDSLTTVINSFPRMLFPFSEYLDNIPLPGILKFKRAMKVLDETVYSIIREKKNSGSGGYDLVSMLISARDEEGKPFFTEREIRDKVITFFIAGQETTANALSWAFYLISGNSKVEEKIIGEISEVLGENSPTYDDVERLVYTNNVVREAMRLYPPAWTVVRNALKDYEIGGYTVPAGSDIHMSQFVVHRDGRIFDAPDEFRPERWTEIMRGELHRFAYFPFGGGTRRCIGEPFAMMEAVLILAIVYSKWRVKLAANSPVKPKPLITIRPEQGVPVILQKRNRKESR